MIRRTMYVLNYIMIIHTDQADFRKNSQPRSVDRGRAFAALGRADRAEAEFARALRLAPDDAKIRDAVRTRPEGHVHD
jgi:Flp pilus assembly protein TadD